MSLGIVEMRIGKMVCMVLLCGCAWLHCTAVPAQSFKQLPPPGIKIDADRRTSLRQRVDQLQLQIDQLATTSGDADQWQHDVEVLVRAVKLALDQNLFFKTTHVDAAAKLLVEATRRIEAVRHGDRGLKLMGLSDQPSDDRQLIVGGFVSQIDGSVQPYGLVVPAGYVATNRSDQRLDVWLHGRGDTKTEVPFLFERMTKKGQYAPADTFVLHPFGRHCNAFKFAGERDVYEAMDRVGELIAVDRTRLAIRGFSMGGAGCWHFAVHDPGRWFAANPGAGFVDTIKYQGWDKNGEPYAIDDTRRRLMLWYDVLPWVTNLKNTNTIAYSGEVDKQRQAADRVWDASRANGFDWNYVIGKGMGHKIDTASAKKIDETLAQWAAQPARSPRREIDLTTYTLRYNRLDWLQITGLEKHWNAARVRGQFAGDSEVKLTTSGVTRLKLDFRESGWPSKPVNLSLDIDGQPLTVEDWDRAPGIQCEVILQDDRWSVVQQVDDSLRKRPGLQGPIDDAFCDRFLFVVPSRPAKHGAVQRWIDREIKYAQQRWRRLMRGKVNVVRDTALTEEQIDSCHLICFGDFSSNRYLASVSAGLPISWTSDRLQVGSKTFDPSTHAAAFCFPNPRNPQRYVVVNSGMTFREFSNVSNSRQIAMLPDWAVLNVAAAEDGIFAGEVVADGFFDEQWKLPPAK